MNKNFLISSPPMGWNSYDYYDTTVNEDNIKANADYMAANLKEYGWEYIVVDIEWYSYDAGTQRDKHQYIPFWRVEMDEYSRLLPCPERFPSSANGQGFKPLADYVHSLGLKFGIHIMRGIPRIAAHNHTKILGTDKTANEIASPYSICSWNPDMYGVIPEDEGSQEYYNSIMNLYAEWGVDFIKCDDICRMDAASSKKEIEMLHKAIQQCGRPMVLSLSPGPARIEEAWHYEKYADMWRITDDFWDDWRLVLNMFERCELWQNHVDKGGYPDCDMLPVGMLGKGFADEHMTHLTRDEQITMMTLWCVFRSPLMIGGELTLLDEWTEKLLTNSEVLSLLTFSHNARQLVRDSVHCVWYSEHKVGDCKYLTVFNLADEERVIKVSPTIVNKETFVGLKFKELWTKETFTCENEELSVKIPAHGAKLYKY
ncbi:alpha-galactosidase [Clostridium cellulovorans]|uniref:Alpha-galactosidase n=1 Tax=Clostridium cellulovorans (strain ATCC 35296 / DSM 3052 / OCM 3 / 743B) TaxID=573061 RepID=D9SWM9_CLOC7|nr:alpha-galactosidase [Clostridium cellulovorans]ADL53311.1 glycoside hydrolase clan GH-D [Clostridium cellulovorans 743B]